MTLTAMVVLLAIIVSLLSAWFPKIELSPLRIEHYLQQVSGHPVKVGYDSVRQYGLDSEIAVHNVTLHSVTGKEQRTLHIDHLSIVMNWWQALLHFSLQPTDITINGVKLTIKQLAAGNYLINGMALQHSTVSSRATMINWLQKRGHVTIRAADINWQPNGHPSYQFHLPRLVMTNRHHKHTLWGHIAIERQRRSDMDIIATFIGNASDWPHLDGQLYLKLHQVDLAEWLPSEWHGYRIKKGDLSGKIWLTWQGQQLQSVHALADVNHLRCHSLRTKKILPIEEISGNFIWQLHNTGWQLLADQVEMTVNQHRWLKNSLQLNVNPCTQTEPPEQRLELSYVDINDLMSLLAADNRLPPHWQTFFSGLKTAGALTSIHFSHHAPLDHLWQQDELSLNLAHVALLPHQHYPGVVGLTGQLHFSSSHAQLAINTPAMDLVLPRFFNHPVNIGRVQGVFNWQQDSHGAWTMVSNNLSASNNDAAVYGNVAVAAAAANSMPTINMVLGFHERDPAHIKQYLPHRFLHPKLAAWLDQAFISGKPISGVVLWHGPMQQLPYLDNQGTFLVSAAINGLTLSYDQAWPVMNNLQGQLTFRNNRMTITHGRGRVYNTLLINADATIPQLKTTDPVGAKLYLNGVTSGDASSTLHFLRESPLINQLGQQIKLIEAKGNMTGELHIIVPLKEPKETQVKGTRRFDNLTLSFPQWSASVDNLSGALSFTEKGATADKIRGKLFGLPIVADIKTLRSGQMRSRMQINLSGQFNSATLKRYFPLLPGWLIDGSSHYQARFDSLGQGQGDVVIRSNLRGVKVDLPPPFGKSASQVVPLQAALIMRHDQLDNLVMDYGTQLHAALKFNEQNNRAQLYSGNFLLGRGEAALRREPGWGVNGYLPQFNWQQWHPYLDRLHQSMSGRNAKFAKIKKHHVGLKIVNMTFGQLQMWGQTLTRAAVIMSSRPNYYNLTITSPQASGVMMISKSQPHGIVARFQHLYLQSTAMNNSQDKMLNPGKLPPLQLDVKEFRFDEVPYGNMQLKWLPATDRLVLQYLHLNSALLSGTVKGEWRLLNGDQHETLLSGNLHSQNIEQLLNQLKVNSSLREGKGSMSFALTWPQSPFKPQLSTLTGNVAANLADGHIVNLGASTDNQIGLGKLLTLLSLHNILTGFHDFKQKGYPFSTMVGNFTFNRGNIQVNRCDLKGSVADINVSGRVNISSDQLNLILTAIPHITDSLGVATGIGVALVNPLVGVAAWVVNKAISPIVNRTAMHTYSVTGSVKKPQVRRINSKR
ncbi:MAG: TIGR02099 family protein [Gammaproteobacteria bacterium]|nr:TIGR02099 family protein [Gammaproteobacteria bacterium]